jgi:flagellar M-ring protein FliF
MSEFFKQLILQVTTLWNKLSATQKIVLSSVTVISLVGLISLVFWTSGSSNSRKGMIPLYTNLEMEESSSIIGALKETGVKFSIENNGSTILVQEDKVYEARMQLASMGLPKTGRPGYEMFDKTSLGQTDFVQKLNFIRALEGELSRTVETLDGVVKARIHIVIPRPSLFTERQQEPTASVVLKLKPGVPLAADQVRGISHVVASAVEGLKSRYVTIMDVSGRLLSNPYGENEIAERSSHQMEIQHSVESYLENKVQTILEGVLGMNKAHTKIAVDLDFDQLEKNIETYNPESKVVRSEERSEEQTTNSPQGDNRKDNSISNYEIDKTVQHIVSAAGTLKRLSVSVAVDGAYQTDKDGKRTYIPRPGDELGKLEDLVKSAVGYSVTRNDQIVVTNVRFDNEYLNDQIREMDKEEKWQRYQTFAKYGLILLIVIFFILFVRYIARSIVEALNPPVPEYAHLVEEEAPPEAIPQNVQRTNEIMNRVEMLVKQEPLNVAQLLRTWLNEGRVQKQQEGKGKK